MERSINFQLTTLEMPIGGQLAELQRGASKAERDTPGPEHPTEFGRRAAGDEQGQGG